MLIAFWGQIYSNIGFILMPHIMAELKYDIAIVYILAGDRDAVTYASAHPA